MKSKKNFSTILPFLEKNQKFSSPIFELEQYITPIPLLEKYFNLFPIEDNSFVVDLGIGTGNLSLLSSLLGTDSLIGIDIDRNALNICKSHKLNKLTLINSSVEFIPLHKFQGKVNGVIMNPPFGTKRKFIDLVFLKKAMEVNGWILSLHKNNKNSLQKIKELADNNAYRIKNKINYSLNLKKTYEIHLKDTHEVNVVLLLLYPNP